MAQKNLGSNRPSLTTSRNDAKRRITEQINKAKTEIPNASVNENDEARRWYDYTAELLRQLFTTDELKDEFTGRSSISINPDITTNAYLKKLISIYERLDLYPEQSPTSSSDDFQKPLSFEHKALIFLQRLYDKVGHDITKVVSVFDLQGDDFTQDEALQIGYNYLTNTGWAKINPRSTGKPDMTITPEGIYRIESMSSGSNTQKPAQVEAEYVDLDRIDELRAIKPGKFDLTRLIRLCEELNSNYANNNHLSVAMLTRTIIHHIPPIFGYTRFEQVANQHQGKSFKKNMQNLQNSLKNIADRHLHSQIRKSESLPTGTQVDFRGDLDVLLEEIVRILK